MTNIGVFDSGVGGLWILKHLRADLPGYNYVFLGDQGHVPYGNKSKEEVKNYSENKPRKDSPCEREEGLLKSNHAQKRSIHYWRVLSSLE